MNGKDWWSRKLTTNPASPNGQGTRPLSGHGAGSIPAAGTTGLRPVLPPPREEAVSDKASAQRNAGRCPQCGGGNFYAHGSIPPRCFDCGYPVPQQAGAGLLSGSGPATPARQVASGGWNPTTIVGRIG